MGSSLCIFTAQEQVAPDELRSFVLGLGGSGDENPKISHLLYSKNGYVMIFLEAEFISVLKEDGTHDPLASAFSSLRKNTPKRS